MEVLKRFRSLKDSKTTQENSSAISQKEPEPLTIKQKTGDAANKWLAKNRSLVLRQTPVWAQSLAGILIGLGAISIVGGIFFRIDEVVTVQGQLKTIGGTISVKTPAGGRVADVFFKDGDFVKKGQKLVQFDTRQASADRATFSRLIDLEIKQINIQLQTLESQRSSLDSRRDVLSQRINTKTTILDSMKALVEQGGFQKLQFLESQDQLYDLQKQSMELNEQYNRISLEADQLRLQSEKSIDQMKNKLKQAEVQLQYQNVVAPVDGIVFDPKATPEGVIQPGERILSIVPQNGLYAEVFVPNKDIGYIKIGQTAKIRVDAFPFTRYGELNGHIKQIAADALPPDPTQSFYRYPVKLDLKQSYLEASGVKIPLKSGMSITTNLKLRDKRVISLVSDMLVDQTDSVRSLRQQ